MEELTHFDKRGRARMVDIGAKEDSSREAVARGAVRMFPETLRLIREGGLAKGDVLAVARIGGIMGAKRTGELIPLCHPLTITGSSVSFRLDRARSRLEIEARIKTTGKTGVEMEALTAVSLAALAIYDMCKAVDRGMVIEDIRLVKKTGGKSGAYEREGEEEWEE